MSIVAVLNQKGGVGKTATSSNLSHALALSGKKIAVIDLDPQGHLTAGFGVDTMATSGVDEVLLNESPAQSMLLSVRDNMDLLASGPKLGEVERIAENNAQWGYRLKNSLKQWADQYDYVFIDCPPASGMLVMNALMASNELLTPVVGDYLALRGLSFLVSLLRRIETASGKHYPHRLILTRFHKRRRLTAEVREKLISYFPHKLLQTPIRETVAIAEAPSYGKTIFEYNKKSYGALDYQQLAEDFTLDRVVA
ncbi:MAG: ParA family protein [bacterium]